MTDSDRDLPVNMKQLGQDFCGALALFAVILAFVVLMSAWAL